MKQSPAGRGCASFVGESRVLGEAMHLENGEGVELKESLFWAMESPNCPCKEAREASHEQRWDSQGFA